MGFLDIHKFQSLRWQGLLNISRDGVIELLTDEAEGLKFKLTDAVDIGPDGTLYFTDASFKYNFKEHIMDFLEGRPHGRFLSYDPSTKRTQVLAKDLYFANGVAVAADQSFVIFCETAMLVLPCFLFSSLFPHVADILCLL